MLVFVYKNLRLDCYSVREEKRRRVGWHGAHVVVRDVTFKVSEAGRQRVLREKCKNVHAGIRGELVSVDEEILDSDLPMTEESYWHLQHESGWQRVRYNPYEGPSFMCDGQPVSRASEALLTPQGVYARGAA